MNAFIKFVEGSTTKQATLEEVKEKLNHYIEMTKKTGEQLDWTYNNSAFPYTVHEKPEAKGQWFYLKGNDPKLYCCILIGVGSKVPAVVQHAGEEGETSAASAPPEEHYIQVTLTDESTHGDKGKANEFCKYLAKEYKAELHLFNGRVIYYNPRK
ncbi:DUF1885 family protein [Aneurinibacillus terranovensis]|uniref:DUF1885 family protein n=1 Tax=Aneurinibacillus terranovensis TaxID=278991 RepID=UPI000556D3B8